MSWDAGGGGTWNDVPTTSDNFGGHPATSGFNGLGDGYSATNGFGDPAGGYGGGGNDDGSKNNGGCYNCGEQGHMKSECPNPRATRENSGACYNCGETGHNKSDCPNPAVPREFTGECRSCGQTGHRSVDCPDAPPRVCHGINECKNPRLLSRDHVADVMPEIAWAELHKAVGEKDIDDIKEAINKYVKALPDTSYIALEGAFRTQSLGVYLIALERELVPTYTNMDLQGNLDRKYTVTYRLSEKPKRPKEADGWPESPEENLERLQDAGEPVDRGIPLCGNCMNLGHTSKFCPEEKQESTDRASVKCYNCDEVGHRVRDCPQPRPDKFACRNCKQSGHGSKECPEPRSAENVDCRKCGETGHFSRDCPTGGGGDSGVCRNCGAESHHAKDCPEPRNPASMTCRNCDATGHMSKECPKPRDYSRVKCSNCQQMGHTKVRCKEPLVEENAGRNNSHGGGFDSGFASAALAANDRWN